MNGIECIREFEEFVGGPEQMQAFYTLFCCTPTPILLIMRKNWVRGTRI